MNKTKQFLDEASIAYYAGSPIISDEVFDRLAESSGYADVGAKQHEHLHKHYHRMYSLDKFYEDEGAAPLAEYKDKTCTVKLDGAAISLLYAEGVLIQALTRGDGVAGTDITDKMYARKDLVPLGVERMEVFQVTGEIVAPKTTVNSRNYAAGSLNLKDLSEFKTRAISFYAYGVYPSVEATFSDDMRTLSYLGFDTVYANDLHNIYPCDGLVFRINNNAEFYALGYTSKHPRGAYAKKERQEAVEAELLSVEWNVSRLGKVVPTAIFSPITIDGKTITRATLNNCAFIEMLDIRIGDTLGVGLAGMIIPEVQYKVSG